MGLDDQGLRYLLQKYTDSFIPLFAGHRTHEHQNLQNVLQRASTISPPEPPRPLMSTTPKITIIITTANYFTDKYQY